MLSSFFFCFSKLNCLLGFRRGKGLKGFHRWLRLWQFIHRILRRTTGKIFLHFNVLVFVLFYCATKRNTAAIKIVLLFESGVYTWFLGWGSPRDSTKVKVEHVGFYSRVQETSPTSLFRFQELRPRWAWVIITVFVLSYPMNPYALRTCAVGSSCHVLTDLK